ncbi:PAS domain S-box protein [Desulfovibrio aerotolerans]|uniref:histidine kinase n=1 Tax=Solidesulfovibrio aerotolerans TaxID=295255 RepID=A0A7C9IM25_9BACT|nr:PAS domain S-box protein [Solidesulfovibrio aerotolerans]MYL84065.1 PAS domain S-box protein [Solidesulfovibrio aerotolerans]
MNKSNTPKKHVFDLYFMQNNAVAICYGISSLIVALLFVGIFLKCIIEKQLDVSAAYRDTSNIARAVEEHAIRTFEQASLLAMSIRFRYEQEDTLDLNSLAKVDPQAMSIFQQLAIINEHGIVSGSSIPGFAPVDLSEREHFKVHLLNPGAGLFVSKPVLGKVSGKWSIQLTTRLTRADKSFAGVVVVSLDPFYLSSFYKDIDIGPNGRITLIGQDDVIRAQKNMNESTFGAIIDDEMVRYLRDNNWDHVNFEANDTNSGIKMLCTYKAVEGFPLSVLISIPENDALSGFYTRRAGYIAFVTCLSILVFILAAWMSRVFRALRDNSDRLRIVFDNSPVGIMHLGSDGTVIDCNEKFSHQMGAPISTILGFNAANKSGVNLRSCINNALYGNIEIYEGPYTSTVGHKESYFRMIFNPVSLTNSPNDVIVTSEDISERIHAQENLRVTTERLQLATQSSGIGIWDYNIENNVLIWDDMMYKIYGINNTSASLTIEEWQSNVHPDDLQFCMSSVERAIRGEEELSIDFRIIWKSDNSIHYLRANALVNRKESGLAHRIIGINLDITARKTAELALQEAYAETEKQVASRTQELARANELLQTEIIERKQAHCEINQILSSISAIIIGVDQRGMVVRWNAAAENIFGLTLQESIGKPFHSLPIPWDWEALMKGVALTRSELKPQRLYNLWYEHGEGYDGYFVITIGPLWNENGGADGILILGDDISELKSLEIQLAQAAKLEAIGQLAAGIAHEINTPTQYVGDSVMFLKDAYADLGQLLTQVEELSRLPSPCGEEVAASLSLMLEEIEVDFLREEIPKTISRIDEGIGRIAAIVLAMKRFSYTSGDEKKAVDIREAIENTLVISRNEWKYVAEATTDFDPELPPVMCLAGDINQVFLNIIVNAAHAIGDVVRESNSLGCIAISTRKDGDFAVIIIKDTGTGIPKEVGSKVFNLFFTTKEVGKGTGQGLAIAYDIVVNKHNGSITFESEAGQGTTFIIRLPLAG